MPKGRFYNLLNFYLIHFKIIPLLILIYPFLFIWQGLDFTDTGFLLTNYQQIFNAPHSVESSFRIWLTNVLGGIWICFFGDSLGLLGYRIAAVILVYATVYLSYLILKPYIQRTYLYWGLFIAVALINRSGYQFNYNSLTAFFYVLSMYFLIKGLLADRHLMTFVSGFFLGLNIFVRLPNIIGFSLVFCILFYGFYSRLPVSIIIRYIFYFVLGYLSSICLIFAVMMLLGHFNAYIDSVKGTFVMLKEPYGHHRGDKLLESFIYLHKLVLSKTGYVVSRLLLLGIVLTLTSRFRKRYFQFLIIFLTGGMWYYFNNEAYMDWYGIISSVLTVLYFGLLLLLANPEKRDIQLTAFAALIVLVITPLGSANGIVNSVFGMYTALPLVFGRILSVNEVKIDVREFIRGVRNKYNIRFSWSELTLIKILSVAMLLFIIFKSSYYYTYRDASDRMKMVYEVNHSMLRGVFTTKERAVVVEELLEVLPLYVNENDYLLAYEQISMVYFLTKTKPYLYSSWPMLYSPQRFQRALNKAREKVPYLPVIVRAKGNTEESSWPKTKGLRRDNYFLDGCRKIMNQFIDDNSYEVAWQNNFFEILLPKNKRFVPDNF